VSPIIRPVCDAETAGNSNPIQKRMLLKVHAIAFSNCYADRVRDKSIKTVQCLSVRPSVCLSQGQRARQQHSRAAAGDAHRRLLHMIRGPRKFWSDRQLLRGRFVGKQHRRRFSREFSETEKCVWKKLNYCYTIDDVSNEFCYIHSMINITVKRFRGLIQEIGHTVHRQTDGWTAI